MLPFRVLVGRASVIQQTGGVDRPLLVVRPQLLLPERFVGGFARRVPHINAERKVHDASINDLAGEFLKSLCL